MQAVASITFCVLLQLYHTVKPKLLFQQTIWLLQLHNCLSLAN